MPVLIIKGDGEIACTVDDARVILHNMVRVLRADKERLKTALACLRIEGIRDSSGIEGMGYGLLTREEHEWQRAIEDRMVLCHRIVTDIERLVALGFPEVVDLEPLGKRIENELQRWVEEVQLVSRGGDNEQED